jgi:hypothetical protein
VEVGAMTSSRRSHRIALVTLALTYLAAFCEPTLLVSAPSRVEAAAAQAQPSAAEAGVRDTLRRYSAALESRDADAVKKVQPSIPIESLAKAFKDMRELKVIIDDVRVLSMDGAAARVSCRVTQTLTPRVGSKQTTAVTRVMRLRREAELWVIDGFER